MLRTVRWMYDTIYRLGVAPYDTRRPCRQLVEIVEAGRIEPGRALVMACGTGTNAMFLAEHGFDVTAFDFAPHGIRVAQKRAAKRGLEVDWRVDDATTMQHIDGIYDLITDCGSLSDIGPEKRGRAWDRMEEHLAPTGYFFHWGFEFTPRWTRPWSRPFATMSLRPGEIQARFGADWEIEELAIVRGLPFRGFGSYLLRRRAG